MTDDLRTILRCRTGALGGHVGRCNDCGHQPIQYNSCRNRHCVLLKETFVSGKLGFYGQLKPLSDPAYIEQLLNQAVLHDWVVYAKRPFSSPVCMLKYLARYTHCVAIFNQRLVSLNDGQVSFHYKNYASGLHDQVMTLETPGVHASLPDAHSAQGFRPLASWPIANASYPQIIGCSKLCKHQPCLHCLPPPDSILIAAVKFITRLSAAPVNPLTPTLRKSRYSG